MPSFSMQKQSARNLVLSPKIQTTWGEYLGDGSMTIRQRFNPSSVFSKDRSLRSDYSTVGKGTEWATNSQTTAWDTKGTLTTEADALSLAWMCSLIFGVDTVTGAGPYTHTFTVPSITATMPPTTIYFEETQDQHFKMCDMCASSLSLTVPERGSVTAALDMVGTGKWESYTMGSLPALIAADYLLGSDVQIAISLAPVSFTGTSTSASPNLTAVSSVAGLSAGMVVTGTGIPANTTIVSASGSTVVLSANATASGTVTFSAAATTSFVGRQKSLSIKVDRQSKPFQSSGDGLTSSSVASGQGKFSVDFTIAAQATDDVNGWFENQAQLSISIFTNPTLAYQFGFTFPIAFVKANKLGNTEDKVMWQLSFDETTCLQSGSQAAISAFVITDQQTFLVAA